MKYLILVFILTLSCYTPILASNENEPNYSVDSCFYSPSLNSSTSKVRFSFQNLPTLRSDGKMVPIYKYEITYSYGVKNETVILTPEKKWFELTLTPGNYSFQMYLNDDHEEITLQFIELKAQHSTYISCHFTRSRYPVIAEKPIIYLYPSSPMMVELKLATKGDLTFTYPNYIDSWNVLAQPSGEILLNEKTYNYLFWEAKQSFSINDFDATKGFAVRRENTISFLEEKLTTFGLTSKEQADFISYWGPRMMNNELNFVQFKFNEECDSFAELSITPPPNSVHRIYLLFSNFDNLHLSTFEPQTIPRSNREGFTVIEWGGIELKTDRMVN